MNRYWNNNNVLMFNSQLSVPSKNEVMSSKIPLDSIEKWSDFNTLKFNEVKFSLINETAIKKYSCNTLIKIITWNDLRFCVHDCDQTQINKQKWLVSVAYEI